jgi:general secretion pathway protein G
VVSLGSVALAGGALWIWTSTLPLDSQPGFNLNRAKSEIGAIQTAIEMFHAQTHRYPTSSEGLAMLVPTFLPSVPKDPWGSEYIYRNGEVGVPTVYSAGPNRRDDGGNADDVVVTFK